MSHMGSILLLGCLQHNEANVLVGFLRASEILQEDFDVVLMDPFW